MADSFLENYGPVLTMGASVISGLFAFLGWSISKRNSVAIEKIKQGLSQAPLDRDKFIQLRVILDSLKVHSRDFIDNCFLASEDSDATDMWYSPRPYLKSLKLGVKHFYRIETADVIKSIEEYLESNHIGFDATDEESLDSAAAEIEKQCSFVNAKIEEIDKRLNDEISKLDQICNQLGGL